MLVEAQNGKAFYVTKDDFMCIGAFPKATHHAGKSQRDKMGSKPISTPPAVPPIENA